MLILFLFFLFCLFLFASFPLNSELAKCMIGFLHISGMLVTDFNKLAAYINRVYPVDWHGQHLRCPIAFAGWEADPKQQPATVLSSSTAATGWVGNNAGGRKDDHDGSGEDAAAVGGVDDDTWGWP